MVQPFCNVVLSRQIVRPLQRAHEKRRRIYAPPQFRQPAPRFCCEAAKLKRRRTLRRKTLRVLRRNERLPEGSRSLTSDQRLYPVNADFDFSVKALRM